MNLLPEEKLIWSPVVVNSRMNRERNASGINSYEQEFKFKPETFLDDKIKENGSASWLDLCCGYGKALMQTAHFFDKAGQQHLIQLHGIDLVDTFPALDPHLTCIDFKTTSLTNWTPGQTYDLITCVHGLHYLGDKLKVITTALKALNPGGLLIANLDFNNIIIKNTNTATFLKKIFKKSGISYNSRQKILRTEGGKEINFGLTYLGADDASGANYTGQEAVTSYYAKA